MMKKICIFVAMFILTLFSVYAEDEYKVYDAKGIVLDVINEEDMNNESINTVQNVKLKILTGKYKGEIFHIKNVQSGNPVYDIPVQKGDKVIVMLEELADGNVEVNIADYVRDEYIFYLIGIFTLILLFIGKFKGLKTLITLIITMISIFKILLPLMLKGYNPIILTVLISTFITVISIFIISGIGRKSISAILGTISGVVIAGILAFIIGGRVKLTGLSAEEAAMLLYIPQNVKFNFQYLLFSGILLGALGAVMDVSMSIASSIEEINKINRNMTVKELFLSGMNIGKDIMGTMANTLILAYTGSSIPLILLFMAYDTSLLKIINLDIVATEIIRSLSGSIGLISTIPITAITAAFLMKKN
ncbi:YibE/F family protein [Caminicella sporogenes]|uniref:YibE/F family protein n=1 Tax=Caminicella sporogenes TaxID=166485 RepID=UPI0025414C33|nr:YibE/F family protein [Caminicella sporogenes]WIF94824.1 YibE/F family protein [Caminicella sporogenes]